MNLSKYIPRKGDKVRLEVEIVYSHLPFNNCFSVRFKGTEQTSLIDGEAFLHATIISRAPRTLTKAEAEKMLSEKLGEEVTIE